MVSVGPGSQTRNARRLTRSRRPRIRPAPKWRVFLLSRAITMVVPMGSRPIPFWPEIRWAHVASPVGRKPRSTWADTSRDASYPHRMRSVERGRAPAMFNCAERVSPLKKVMVADTTLPSPASRLSSPIEALRAKPLRVATRSSGPISTISLPLTKTSMIGNGPARKRPSEHRDIDLLGRGQDGGSTRVVDRVEPGEIGILADAKGGDRRSIKIIQRRELILDRALPGAVGEEVQEVAFSSLIEASKPVIGRSQGIGEIRLSSGIQISQVVRDRSIARLAETERRRIHGASDLSTFAGSAAAVEGNHRDRDIRGRKSEPPDPIGQSDQARDFRIENRIGSSVAVEIADRRPIEGVGRAA